MNPYKKRLINVLARIQNCWTHDDDGSDLRKSHSSHLFSLIFNDLKSAIVDEDYDFHTSRFKKDEKEETKYLKEKDYSFKQIISKAEAVEDTVDFTEEIVELKKQIRNLEGQIENWYKPWERDARKYLEILERHKICPTCESVDKVCDCPFG